MKTKLTLAITAIWAILVALNEAGVLDLLPFDDNTNGYLKFLISLFVTIGNTLFVEPEKAKQIFKSIGGGGIKNPPPNN
jgi:hypothetical protein